LKQYLGGFCIQQANAWKGATGGSASILLYNVLWVDVGTSDVTIKFAAAKFAKLAVKPSSLSYSYDIPSRSEVENWAVTLLQAAYEGWF
jgi:hypothetical protein